MKKLLCLLLVLLLLTGCSTGTEGETQMEDRSLDGKRVLFVGDSFLFTGRAVLLNKEVTEEGRRYDTGYFYQLCKAKGAEVAVTNWTYGGTGIGTIMESYIPLFKEYSYDYVILSGGRNSANTFATLSKTLDEYLTLFRGANPNVKLFYLVTSGAHNISVKESFSMDVLNNLEKIEEKGITVLDWGKMVADIIRGEVEVPGATLPYDKYSFVHNKSLTDGFHPNQLSGYIVSLFVYCAITGESAVGLPYDFWNKGELHKQFDPVSYLTYGYALGPTNYQEIFASPTDMEGLQKLVDQYMAEKAYLTYNFTEVPQN
ncbi:MAG: SGNH/GDSL hydrolase family protein [Oscillospiraceae bacterium]|nr:SGNH/GDSL hydrolase family protein [Oscillospiraceae bacterium]